MSHRTDVAPSAGRALDADPAAMTVGGLSAAVRWRSRHPQLASALLLATYVLAGVAGRATRLPGTPLALVWPAAAVGFLWLALVWHDRRRLALEIALLSTGTVIVNTATGASLTLSLVFALANTALATTTCALVRRCSTPGRSPWVLRTPRDLLVLAVASFGGSLASAAVGPVGLWLLEGADLRVSALAWTLRNASSTFAFAALALRLGHDRHPGHPGHPARPSHPAHPAHPGHPHTTALRPLELAAVTVVLSAAYLTVFGLHQQLPLAFLLLPLSLWLALRFPTTLVAAHVLLVGVFVVLETMAGNGPFAVPDPAVRVLLAQAFVAVTGLVALSLALFRDERQRLVDELAAARDEAEHRQALGAAVLDTIDVGVAACDAEGRLTLFNRAARDAHGVEEDPTLRPDDWAGHYSLFAEDGTTPLGRDDVPLVRALVDGRVHGAVMVIRPLGRPAVTVRCDGRRLVDAAGRPRGAVVAMTDVTQQRLRDGELQAARDEALASTRAKSAFLAAASHEIRTPLNGVLGTLELLAMQPLPQHEQGLVAVARDSGAALLRLVNDVLDLSQAETTSLVLRTEPFCPDDVAADVVTALRPVALRRALALHLEGGAGTVVCGDAGRLRQVLMNLVGNALKFTPQGSVTVRAATAPCLDPSVLRLRLSVCDTGPGIDPEELRTLFQPFVQGSAGVSRGGTGLGLVLSRQIVEAMGGRIVVDSAPGQGSEFVVEVDLPVVAAPATSPADPAPARPDPQPATQPDLSGLRVLLADDSDVNLLVAEAMLQAEGAEVVTVTDGEQALRAVEGGRFDLALLDNWMPEMTGLQAAAAIRALPGPAARTRLVALTASEGDQVHDDLRAAGMDDVLLKPVTRELLRAALLWAVAA